jgi:futalosine hydrolase
MLPRLLIVTAVAAERDAVLAGVGEVSVLPDPLASDAAEVDVIAVGVGPARAASGTLLQLAQAEADLAPYHAVICAGVAGALPGRAEIGDLVVATASVAADLGAESPDGFLPIEDLGFGVSTLPADPSLFPVHAARSGTILTVSTATGTAATAEALATRYPEAVAEAMEGFGVATAAAQLGLPYAEVRAISNIVGPRDTGSWRLPTALTALTAAFTVRKVTS